MKKISINNKRSSKKIFIVIALILAFLALCAYLIYPYASVVIKNEHRPDIALERLTDKYISSIKADELSVDAKVYEEDIIEGSAQLFYENQATLPVIEFKIDNKNVYINIDGITINEGAYEYYRYTNESLIDYIDKKPGEYNKRYDIDEYSDFAEALGKVTGAGIKELIKDITFKECADKNIIRTDDSGEQYTLYAYEMSISATDLEKNVYNIIDNCYADSVVNIQLSLLAGVYKYKKEDMKADYSKLMEGVENISTIMYIDENNDFAGLDAQIQKK